MKAAILSPCRTWRYWLERGGERGLTCLFVCLNPSTADAERDDPTVRRCLGFARAWGYERMGIVNLFALRSQNPLMLQGHPDPVGPANDRWIRDSSATAGKVVCAWGAHGTFYPDRVRQVLEVLSTTWLYHLGLTKDGQPRHPLYLSGRILPERWTPSRSAA